MRTPLWEHLSVHPGITTVIGSGGKTTLLRALGEELAAAGKRVVLTTTTKIYPFSGMPVVTGGTEELERAFGESPILCCGTPLAGVGKLSRPALALEELARRADYVLVEGDGSAGLPLKAHRENEPVIPPGSNEVIQVVGWSGVGQKISRCVHCPDLFARLAGVDGESLVTPRLLAAVLNREGLAGKYLINQADDPDAVEAAKSLGRLLSGPCHIGSLERREIICL